MNNTTNQIEYDFSAYHADRMLQHYAHAREKHPYFCDNITYRSARYADIDLEVCRKFLEAENRAGNVKAVSVIFCELHEAMQAYAHGDIASAVEECYDTISVLLRMVDVLEGRQKLGKLETEGDSEHGQ